jgi:hypothetical protein
MQVMVHCLDCRVRERRTESSCLPRTAHVNCYGPPECLQKSISETSVWFLEQQMQDARHDDQAETQRCLQVTELTRETRA